jgi:hypothetical protein
LSFLLEEGLFMIAGLPPRLSTMVKRLGIYLFEDAQAKVEGSPVDGRQ